MTASGRWRRADLRTKAQAQLRALPSILIDVRDAQADTVRVSSDRVSLVADLRADISGGILPSRAAAYA